MKFKFGMMGHPLYVFFVVNNSLCLVVTLLGGNANVILTEFAAAGWELSISHK